MASSRNETVTGVGLALGGIFSVQIGAALATPIFERIGPAATAWLRLCWAAAIFLAIARPRLSKLPRRDLASAAALGFVSAANSMMFFEGIARIPLATVVAIEFLGPLGVAVWHRSGPWGLAWPPLAFAGVLLVTEPWHGDINLVGVLLALGAGVGWGAYILLTQRVGDRFHGIAGLSIAMPVAALAATPVGAFQAWGRVDGISLLLCAGLALLFPVASYSLELNALRKLDTATFGTLMSIEPAAALLVGAVGLHQIPDAGQVLGVLFVTIAAIGAARTGQREIPAAPESTRSMNADALPK
ncbi:EamA family transporter [Pendulispora brunnea]|uniref:EamA family transporter n=1 Tax=Pendulispora brunnea TaxID=2905690 RepID=A0ABZ2KCN8_9BACT